MGNREMNSAEASAGLYLPPEFGKYPIGQPSVAADMARLTALVADLTAANARLMVRVEAARVLIEEIARQPDYRVPSPQDLALAFLAGGAE